MINKVEGDAAAILANEGPVPMRSAKKGDSPPANEGPVPARSAKKGDSPPPAYGFRLKIDDNTHEVIALIVNPETQEVIREIPPEEMRAAADVIRNLIGPLVDKRV